MNDYNTNRHRNIVTNLRYTDYKGNANNKESLKNMSRANLNNCEYAGRSICQYDLYGHYIKTYTLEELNEQFSKHQRVLIYRCCNGGANQTDAHMWRWADEVETGKDIESFEDKSKITIDSHLQTDVNQYDKQGKYIKTWTQKEIHRVYDKQGKTIFRQILDCCRYPEKYKTALNYQWRYNKNGIKDIEPINFCGNGIVLSYVINIIDYNTNKSLGLYANIDILADAFNLNHRKARKCLYGELKTTKDPDGNKYRLIKVQKTDLTPEDKVIT